MLNHCKLNGIKEQSKELNNIMSLTDSINLSDFNVYSENVIVYRSLFNINRIIKRRTDKINYSELGIKNIKHSILKMKHVSNRFYFSI